MSVVLSKVMLDIRHPSVRQALRDANDMHRNLMAGFSMDETRRTPRAEQQILYRLFTGRDQIYLLVSSVERPDASALAKRGFYTDESLMRDISALKDTFRLNHCLKFEIFASPCKKVGCEGKNSRRVFLDSENDRVDWLRRKGTDGGFSVLQVEELSKRIDVFARRGAESIKNSGVVFAGILRVADADLFWKSLANGIGPGKAYGLGMLNVANA